MARVEVELSAAAVGHLAHELSGGLHTIIGHTELLVIDGTTPEVSDSAAYIHEAAERLRGVCDDVVDLLRLPVLVDRGVVRLSLDALVRSAAPGPRRGAPVQTIERFDGKSVAIDATVHRVVSHVIGHILRVVRTEVTVVASTQWPERDTCTFTASTALPAPWDNSVLAIAAILLEAHGGALHVGESAVEIRVPVREWD